MGSFKLLSEPDHSVWTQYVQPDIYQPFQYVRFYLRSLSVDSEMFANSPIKLTHELLLQLGCKELELLKAFERDVQRWQNACARITTFPDTFQWAVHTSFIVEERFPETTVTIDDKINVMIKKEMKYQGSNIWYCRANLYPLVRVYVRRGGSVSVTSYKPEMIADNKGYTFVERSKNVVLPDWLNESTHIQKADRSGYESSIKVF
jgi:hypothetical protein